MKRLLLVPIGALALLSYAVPASAQSIDLPALRLDARHTHTAVTHVQRTVNRCQAPDDTEVLSLAEHSNLIAQQSAGLAPQVGGRQHVEALSIYDTANSDFYWLTSYQSPPICYQPPAE